MVGWIWRGAASKSGNFEDSPDDMRAIGASISVRLSHLQEKDQPKMLSSFVCIQQPLA